MWSHLQSLYASRFAGQDDVFTHFRSPSRLSFCRSAASQLAGDEAAEGSSQVNGSREKDELMLANEWTIDKPGYSVLVKDRVLLGSFNFLHRSHFRSVMMLFCGFLCGGFLQWWIQDCQYWCALRKCWASLLVGPKLVQIRMKVNCWTW